MELPKNIMKAVRKPVKGTLKVRTFVFDIKEIAKDTYEMNQTLEAFCEVHDVSSVVFSEVHGRLVYVLIYRDYEHTNQTD